MLDELIFTGGSGEVHWSYAVVVGLVVFLLVMVVYHKMKGPFGRIASVMFTGAVFLLGASTMLVLNQHGMLDKLKN